MQISVSYRIVYANVVDSTVVTITNLQGDCCVSAVTSLGDDVFVVREESDLKEVEVYDAVTLTLQRRLPVPGLGNFPRGLAACARDRCLCVSNFDYSYVHRVDLSGSNAVMKWSVARCPVGLSLNDADNVLVVSRLECRLQEFTTRGALLRNIQLQADIERPQYVIQLSVDRFVVSHDGSLHRVCLVDENGSVVRSYGGHVSFGLNHPRGLASDRHGNVLVADMGNGRLLVLAGTLTSANEMSVSVDAVGALTAPRSLWYDKTRRRLYVGEQGRCSLVVVDRLTDFNASQV